ncbi:hypothetical protein K445DRAFT_177009 [Daldinia sp. EC12]|nr:hypothetical protein K445DRAFT_177009 [Daldinia sp. EC12]
MAYFLPIFYSGSKYCSNFLLFFIYFYFSKRRLLETKTRRDEKMGSPRGKNQNFGGCFCFIMRLFSKRCHFFALPLALC